MPNWAVIWSKLALVVEINLCLCFLDKNTKEAFLKKLKLCMQNFDYKDETKDVKGKVSLLHLLTIFA